VREILLSCASLLFSQCLFKHIRMRVLNVGRSGIRGGEAARVPAAAMALFFRSSGPGKGKISE
jgi:hypothetical protein